ncbi:MAG: ABC transporter permease subunit [Lachnospiraceae bacterium]|jgi:arabinogalactan oligomer/maltooligosaccharide transport system permease protein|nr:ABC transporter permease subunit [Lachnospiraceae bacterium]
MKAKRMITNAACYVLLTVLSIIWVLPILFVILTSFREEGGSYKTYIWPKGFTLNNYKELVMGVNSKISGGTNIDFTRWFFNTLVIAIFSTLLSAFFVLCVSYVMSRLRFKMRKNFMNIAMILGMFPGFMSMIAVYYILKGLGLLETGTLKQLSLILVYSGGAGLGFYMAKGFFDTISRSIDEAAYIDGATKWDTFTKITIPLSKPIITYTLLTSFMGPWVDYIFAKVIMGNDTKYYTIAIGLWTMLEKEYVDYYYTQFYAGCVLISIPIAIVFLLSQSCYVEGVSGAVKG